MRKSRKWVQILIFSVALLIGGITIGQAILNKDVQVKPGNTAPDFTLTGLDGQKYQLSDFSGKVVILNFWGTFCPPCVREMPALQQQYEYWKSRDVEVFGVNLNEGHVTVQSFIKQYNITFPILMDNDQVRKTYRVTSFPTTFYIDKNGKIRDKFVGEMKEEDIQQRVNQMLN